MKRLRGKTSRGRSGAKLNKAAPKSASVTFTRHGEKVHKTCLKFAIVVVPELLGEEEEGEKSLK